MSRPVLGVCTLATIVRRVAWLPAAAVLALPFATPGSPVSLVRVALQSSPQLTISGAIDGLRPGVAAGLTLTLRNGSDAPVTVRTVRVRVTSAPAGCPAGALAPGSWRGALVVPAHSAAEVLVPVTLDDPGGRCTGATWRLAYTSA